MKWLLRPSVLTALLTGLVFGAVALVVWPRNGETRAMPVREGEREIVWLYAATSGSTWERFVAAVQRAAVRLKETHPGLVVQADKAFPIQTTAVPELSMTVQTGGSRLLFRWYKLTSDQKSQQWVEALCNRSPPPLAIIGGSSSDTAIEMAEALRPFTGQPPQKPPPLLLLTTATADQELNDDGTPGQGLCGIHAGRTFRFCFTNRQMADAVTRFLWEQPTLRPDVDVLYQAVWLDDAYSMDLTERFSESLRLPIAARAATQEWGWLSGAAATGGWPVNLVSIADGHFTLPLVERIDYSVGLFDQPNRWELPVVRRLMDAKESQYPGPRRPLLVLSAASSQPARRLLRGLERTSPTEARRFVIATGDALAFNAIYRDRNVVWPIQDLPFDLVLFCHRNPVSTSAGFPTAAELREPGRLPSTGTEDLLLFTDIVESLVQACCAGEVVPATGDELGRRLRRARWHDGRIDLSDEGVLLFDEQGNRRSGTGEHIVWLRPIFKGERVLPRSVIEIWRWTDGWHRHRALDVEYDDFISDR